MRRNTVVFVAALVLNGLLISAAAGATHSQSGYVKLSTLQERARAAVLAKTATGSRVRTLFSRAGTAMPENVLLNNLTIDGQNPATVVYGDTVQIDFDYDPGEAAAVLMSYLDIDGDTTLSPSDVQVLDKIVLVDNGPMDQDSTVGHFSARVPSLMLFPAVSNYILLLSNGVSETACYVFVQVPPSPAFSISGTVVDPANVAGIVVIASFGDMDHGPEEGRLVAALTDTNGAFFIPVPDYLAGDTAMVMAMDFLGVTNGYLMSPPQMVYVDGNVAGLTLAMIQAAAWVRVHLSDDTGNPIPNVRVYLETEGPGTQARTDSSGIAILGGLPDQEANVDVEQMDLWPQYLAPDGGHSNPRLVLGDTLDVPVVVHQADAAIQGTVTVDGQPAAGIMLGAWSPEGHSWGYSDYLGHFSIPVWSGADGGYWVSVDEEYVPPGHFVHGPAGPVYAGQTDVLFEIWPAAGAIFGYVTDATTGQPIEGAWVEAKTDTSWAGGDDTDENGYYEIPVQNGTYKVYVWHDGYLPQMDSVTVADDRVQVDFALQPFSPATIEGMVRDQSGNPLEGIEVIARADSPMFVEQHAQTGPDGAYQLGDLPPGRYIVEAYGELWARQFYDHVATWDSASYVFVNQGETATGIDFDLMPGGAIRGVVRDAATGQPIDGAHVRAEVISDSLSPWTYWFEMWVGTGPDGQYTIGGLPPGKYVVQADKMDQGYMAQLYDHRWPWEVPDTVVVSGGAYTDGIDFDLTHGCAIGGWVVDSTWTPADSALVVAERRDGLRYEARTDSAGNFLLMPIEPGAYQVYAIAPGYDTTWYAGPDSMSLMWLNPGDWFTSVTIVLGTSMPLTGVAQHRNEGLPKAFGLAHAYPNPFNPETTIEYDVPKAARVQIAVFDALGRRLAILVDGQVAAGRHSVVWNGTDGNGHPVGSGVYFAVMKAGNRRFVSKMLLVK